MQNTKEKRQLAIFSLLLFVFFTIFFVTMHPMVIFDTDDWDYIYSIRSMIPTWGNWNPAKLFPEIVMGIVSQLAASILYPITGDYINALTWGHGLFTSIVILIYVLLFMKLLQEKFQLSSETAISYGILFVVLHFLIFRITPSGNVHLFFSSNVTCYYNYTIPTLLNCIAVMILMRIENHSKLWEEKNAIAKGIFYVFIYFCIFSNLFSSVILMSYVGVKLVIALCKELFGKSFKLVRYVVDNKGFLMIFVLWITQQIFEMNGGRASSLSTGSLWEAIQSTINALRIRIYEMNKWFIGTIVIVLALSIFVIIKKWKEEETKQILQEMGQVLFALVLTMIYLLLVCSRAAVGYISRCDVLIGPVFLGFLFVFMGLTFATKKFPEMNAMIPILIVALFCETNTMGNTYLDSNMGGLTAETCIEIGNNIVEQVKAADEKGAYSMQLFVPDFQSEDNWPIALYGGVSISEALSKHGVIRQPIYIEIVPTTEKNEQFHFSY